MAPVFGAPVDVSPIGQKAFGPRVHFDAAGNALAIWDDCTAGCVIRSGKRPAGGAFAQDAMPSAGVGQGYSYDFGSDSAGEAIAAWSNTASANQTIQVAIRPAAGPFAAPATLSSASYKSEYPKIAVNQAGDAIVAWQIHNLPANKVIVQAAYRPHGGAFGPAFDVSGDTFSSSADPVVAIDESGQALVAWSEAHSWQNPPDPIYNVVRGRVRGGGAGGAWGTPFDIASDTALDYGAGPVAFDGAGNVIAIIQAGGTGPRLFSAIRPNGGSFGTPVALDAAGALIDYPELDVDANGNAIVVWGHRNTANDSDIVDAAFRPAGGSFGAPVPVSAPQGANPPGLPYAYPDVSFDAFGNASAIWTYWNGSHKVVQTAFRPAGGSFAPAVTLSDPALNSDAPSVDQDAAGDTLVMWTESDATGYGKIVAAFASPPKPKPPAGSVTITGTTVDKKTGALGIDVAAPEPGSVSATATFQIVKRTRKGKKLRTIAYGNTTATAAGAGHLALTISPSGTARRQLKHGKAIPVTINVSFIPQAGAPSTASTTLKAKLKKKRKR